MTIPNAFKAYRIPNLYTYPEQSHSEQVVMDVYLINAVKANSVFIIKIKEGPEAKGKLISVTYHNDRLPTLRFSHKNGHMEFSIDEIEGLDLAPIHH